MMNGMYGISPPLQGLKRWVTDVPKALPWAIMGRPFGAGSMHRLPRLRQKFEEPHDEAHPLRRALDQLQTLETIRIIEGKP